MLLRVMNMFDVVTCSDTLPRLICVTDTLLRLQYVADTLSRMQCVADTLSRLLRAADTLPRLLCATDLIFSALHIRGTRTNQGHLGIRSESSFCDVIEVGKNAE